MKHVLILYTAISFAQIGIGTTTPNHSSVLDLTSSNKGFLPPRLSSNQRNAIINPAEGLTIYNTDLKCLDTYNGFRWNNCQSISSTDVYNPVTGKIWMDRNLGATQVATAINDFRSYGSLFQWGRAADGHQLINWVNANNGVGYNSNRSERSTTNTPFHSSFIKSTALPKDWRNVQNNNLWQGVNGINNPCPNGYRLPTASEWNAERLTWPSNNANGAFASNLKLPLSSFRNFDAIPTAGLEGYYWSSTTSTSLSKFIQITNSAVIISENYRAYGLSVRCIKD